MRLTESEMRRRVRSALLEADRHYVGWEGYAPRWTVPIPPQIMAALVRICTGVSEHIEQNYPPRPESGYVFGEQDVDLADEWAQEIKRVVKGDPVVERGLLGVITLFRSLLPSNLRTHVSTAVPTVEMTFARGNFLDTVAHAFNVFRDNPEGRVSVLLSTLAITWGGYTTRQGLISEGNETLSTKPWPDCTNMRSGTGPLPPAINTALIKICSSAAEHVEQNYPRPQTSALDEEWSKETVAAMKGDPTIERAVKTVLSIYKTMIPTQVRSLIDFDGTRSNLGTEARRYVCVYLAHPWLPFNEFSDSQLCMLVATLSRLCKEHLEEESYTD